jgi:fumarate reductase subunit D
MENDNKSLGKGYPVVLLLLLMPFVTLADSFAVSEQTQGGKTSLYAEIAIGVVFVIAVTVFVIWKAKHDKKMREKQMEQMRKLQATKRKAA